MSWVATTAAESSSMGSGWRCRPIRQLLKSTSSATSPECKAIHLAHFAIMGNIYSREILGRKTPRVGILSNGSEEIKGNDLTREALKLCQQLDLNFIGYVEGNDLFSDHVEVAVTDGF